MHLLNPQHWCFSVIANVFTRCLNIFSLIFQWNNYLNEVVQMNKMQAESPDENAEIYFKSFQGKCVRPSKSIVCQASSNKICWKKGKLSEMFELGIWGWSWYQVQPSNNKNSDNYLKDWVGNKHGISNCIWEGWRELTLISCCIFVVGILKHLTDVLELRDFLQILPDEGNMLFFLPYITECQEKEKSKQLLNIIRKKGEHLQHYIWYLLICVVKVHVLD